MPHCSPKWTQVSRGRPLSLCSDPGPAPPGAGLILRQTLKTRAIGSFSTATKLTFQNRADTAAVSFWDLLTQVAHPPASPSLGLLRDLGISLGARAATRRLSAFMQAASNKTFATTEAFWTHFLWKMVIGACARCDVNREIRPASSGVGLLTLA